MNKKLKSLIICFLSIFSVILFYACEKELSVTPPENKPDNGLLFISSSPDKAEIFLNGKRTGDFTPDTLEWLKDGVYSITLKKKLFLDTTFNIEAKDGELRIIDVQYFQNPKMFGKIKCESNPAGADIFLDGDSTGFSTPSVLNNVKPGIHKIHYRKNGFWPHEKDCLVKSYQTSLSQFALEDTSQWVTYDMTNSGIPATELSCIDIDNENRKWIGTEKDGIIIYDEKSWSTLTQENSSLPSNRITKILIDDFNKKYIGTDEGLVIIDGESWTIYNTDNTIMPSNLVTSFDINGKGDFMIGTKQGIVRYFSAENRWLLLSKSNSYLPGNWISAVKFENEYDYWVCVLGAGLLNFHDFKWSGYGYDFPDNNIPDPMKLLPSKYYLYINSIGIGHNNQIWFCSNDTKISYLFLYDKDKWHIVYSLGANLVNSFFVDEKDYIWMCTYNGLIKYKLNITPTIIYTTSNSGIRDNYITDIKKDVNGVLWMSTYGGLTKKKK